MTNRVAPLAFDATARAGRGKRVLDVRNGQDAGSERGTVGMGADG